MPYFIVSGFDRNGEPYTSGIDASSAEAVPELVQTWAAHPSRRPIAITKIELIPNERSAVRCVEMPR